MVLKYNRSFIGFGVKGRRVVRWLWPQKTNDQNNLIVRIGRLVHWVAIGLAAFGLMISFFGLVQAGAREPIPYLAVGLMWLGLAMFGRGLRYVLARE